MFSSLSSRKIVILATLILLSANAFNLVMFKIKSFSKELKRHEAEAQGKKAVFVKHQSPPQNSGVLKSVTLVYDLSVGK